jgi:hypothetical protein
VSQRAVCALFTRPNLHVAGQCDLEAIELR